MEDLLKESTKTQAEAGDAKEVGEAKEMAQETMESFEDSLKEIQEGNLVKGTIVQIDQEHVSVDIGYKTEGSIPIREFRGSNGEVPVKVGDEVDVLLVRRETRDGNVILSREKATKIMLWNKVKKIHQENGVIKGTIVSRVKGGFSVDIGHDAFLPASQVDLRPSKDSEEIVGTEYDFKILKYDRRKENIVLSRRAILEDQRNILRQKTLGSLQEGAVIEGVVKNITDYGLFVDLGGIDGLVHVTNLSWGKIGHPSTLYKVDDKVPVKVLSLDREKGKVSLGIKQLASDPWANTEEKYPPGSIVSGRVVSFKDYGAFVEVSKGLEGLIHVSEMSWTRKIGHPNQVLKIGDQVEAVVLNVDAVGKRFSLSLKKAQPNPWDAVAEKYPVGTIIEGKVKNITEFGLFVGIDEGIDGLVHVSDISWSKKVKKPSDSFQKGQIIRALVLKIDKENERFSLGIKQLTTDPWNSVSEKYRRGMRVTGKVTRITDFGLFVELEEGIEGLLHISELPENQSQSRFQPDDVIQAEVIHVSRRDQKLGLSIKRMEESSEKELYKSYVNSKKEATSNLGDLLRRQMVEMQDQDIEEKRQTEQNTDSGPDTPSGEKTDL
jgi:small subunit ribosomal protein S1